MIAGDVRQAGGPARSRSRSSRMSRLRVPSWMRTRAGECGAAGYRPGM